METSFRVWSEDFKKMFYKGMLTFDISDGTWLFENTKVSFHSSYGKTLQSTGFYSKNKKEIFQGDILQKGKAKCTVILLEAKLDFGNQTSDWLDEWNWADDAHRFDVIGNIYENPELAQC